MWAPSGTDFQGSGFAPGTAWALLSTLSERMILHLTGAPLLSCFPSFLRYACSTKESTEESTGPQAPGRVHPSGPGFASR